MQQQLAIEANDRFVKGNKSYLVKSVTNVDGKLSVSVVNEKSDGKVTITEPVEQFLKDGYKHQPHKANGKARTAAPAAPTAVPAPAPVAAPAAPAKVGEVLAARPEEKPALDIRTMFSEYRAKLKLAIPMTLTSGKKENFLAGTHGSIALLNGDLEFRPDGCGESMYVEPFEVEMLGVINPETKFAYPVIERKKPEVKVAPDKKPQPKSDQLGPRGSQPVKKATAKKADKKAAPKAKVAKVTKAKASKKSKK